MTTPEMDLESSFFDRAGYADGHSSADDLEASDVAIGAVVAGAVVGVGALVYLAATHTPSPEPAAPSPNATAPAQSDPGTSGPGLGMSYSGKLGMELAPGLVYTFDGDLELGFGFGP